VINSINKEFGIDGESYLDKIIQVDYRIPDPLDEQIEFIFFELVESFCSENKIYFDKKEIGVLWLVHSFKSFFKNLRDIYRYLNALKVRLPIIHRDVNVTHFMVIEAIRIFDYASYSLIQSHLKNFLMFG